MTQIASRLRSHGTQTRTLSDEDGMPTRMTVTRRGTRFALVATALAALALSMNAQSQSRKFDLLTAGVADIQNAVESGKLTYERLVEMYLQRIEVYDKNGPKLNAVVAINPKAREIARELDKERTAKGRRSPLHGIPIAVKDTVDVKDIASAGGNLALKGTFPKDDATVVKRLRDAGAIIFFKANLDEFNLGAQGISTFGPTGNPYHPSRNPGGSSSGPAVSVNVGFATLGIATETGASIRSPASNNSIVGVAPTQGLTSRAGIIVICTRRTAPAFTPRRSRTLR